MHRIRLLFTILKIFEDNEEGVVIIDKYGGITDKWL